MQRVAAVLLAAGLSATPASVLAEPSAVFEVSATIDEGCLVDQSPPVDGAHVGSLGSLDFGTDSNLSQATHEAALLQSVTLSCTPGIDLSMQIGAGLHDAGGERRLRLGAAGPTLVYTLFRDAGFQDPLGIDQAVAIDTVTDPDDIRLPVWGRLTLPGTLPAGVFSDELLVTLEW